METGTALPGSRPKPANSQKPEIQDVRDDGVTDPVAQLVPKRATDMKVTALPVKRSARVAGACF